MNKKDPRDLATLDGRTKVTVGDVIDARENGATTEELYKYCPELKRLSQNLDKEDHCISLSLAALQMALEEDEQ